MSSKGFLLYTAMLVVFVLFPGGCASDPEEAAGALYERQVDGNLFDTTPVRGELKPLELRRGSFVYRCTECHNDFQNEGRQEELKGEHAEIQARFNHGLNTICLNCHHPRERTAYVDHDGSAIPSEHPERLCAKCHGPVYREWQLGIHGRQNGYWNRTKGPRSKLVCTQCHDPHHPAFALMTPDPPPDFSRLEKKRPEQHVDTGAPLAPH